MQSELTEPIEIAIPARPEYVGVVRLVISALANLLQFDQETTEDIKTAVSEACTNAILQTPPEMGDRKVDLVARSSEDKLLIDINFRGSELGLAGVEPIRTPAQEGDLSLSILTSLMDKVELIRNRDTNVTLRLVKSLPSHSIQ